MSDVKAGAASGPQEIDLLRQRAKLMGVTYKDTDDVATIKAAIEAKSKKPETPEPEQTTAPNALEQGAKAAEAKTTAPNGTDPNVDYSNDPMRLIRLRITNMDPKKKDLHGEIMVVANEQVGTIRKFIPFGEATENGYHVPYMLYKFMKRKKFLHIRSVKNKQTGTNSIKTSWAHEFALEVLPPLTEKELKDLAVAQIAAGSIDMSDDNTDTLR